MVLSPCSRWVERIRSVDPTFRSSAPRTPTTTNQDLPRITTLALVYTLAGADCIDMSASEAVVTAVTEVRCPLASLTPRRRRDH